MLKTGPSLQTHKLPSTVSSTQHRQAPTPQAIRFSSETSHSMLLRIAYAAIALHHRHRTAAVKHLPRLLQCRVLGDQSMLAHRAVVGRHIHTSNLLKLLKLEQIALAARPQQESHFKATFFQLTAKIEHRRHSDTSAGKKHASTPCRQGWKTLCRAAAQDSARGASAKATRWRVPSPATLTRSHNSLRSRSTKFIEIGRRRNVDLESGTSTSTNCPAQVSMIAEPSAGCSFSRLYESDNRSLERTT